MSFTSSRTFPNFYGGRFPVTEPYERYLTAMRSLIGYWVQLDIASFGLMPSESTEQENDSPKAALENSIKGVET